MGTLSASRSRFPVSRETLNVFRAAGGEKEGVRDRGGERVEGETETSRGTTELTIASYPGAPCVNRPRFPEATDLEGGRKENDRFKEKKIHNSRLYSYL
ncbi:hypothetical protein NDU88_000777 [Pleurodeles waltl]|uniref:Uncharacterized protein n=1 Tax=Pleurodeles waltl TaxID=8319 RepID=A0AAV7LXA8_PLEWA|nr:hypothetical protein NDU88_000777 [Pleurodeles waltl]